MLSEAIKNFFWKNKLASKRVWICKSQSAYIQVYSSTYMYSHSYTATYLPLETESLLYNYAALHNGTVRDMLCEAIKTLICSKKNKLSCRRMRGFKTSRPIYGWTRPLYIWVDSYAAICPWRSRVNYIIMLLYAHHCTRCVAIFDPFL